VIHIRHYLALGYQSLVGGVADALLLLALALQKHRRRVMEAHVAMMTRAVAKRVAADQKGSSRL
jgi:hypothetical protein